MEEMEKRISDLEYQVKELLVIVKKLAFERYEKLNKKDEENN